MSHFLSEGYNPIITPGNDPTGSLYEEIALLTEAICRLIIIQDLLMQGCQSEWQSFTTLSARWRE